MKLNLVLLAFLIWFGCSHSQKHLNVGTLHEPPYVYVTEKSDGSKEVDGFLYQILLWLAKHNHFNYTIKTPQSGSYGVLVEGRWTGGLIGMLLNQEIDMTVAPFILSQSRFQVADYTYPVAEGGSALMIPFPTTTNKYGVVAEPFHPNVWLLLAASFIVTAFTLTVLSVSNKRQEKYTILETFSNHALTMLLILTNQGATINTRHPGKRFLLTIWCLLTCVITYAYNGSLLSFLMKPKMAALVDSIEDLAKSEALSPIIQAGTIHFNNIMNSKTGPQRVLGDYLLQHPENIIPHKNACSSLVATGKYACISDKSVLDFLVTEDRLKTGQCRVTVATKTFASTYSAFMLPKNSSHLSAFTKDIMWLHEVGLMIHWNKMYWYKPNKCNDLANPQRKAKLQVFNLSGAFILLCAGSLTSFLVFLIERFIHSKSGKVTSKI